MRDGNRSAIQRMAKHSDIYTSRRANLCTYKCTYKLKNSRYTYPVILSLLTKRRRKSTAT